MSRASWLTTGIGFGRTGKEMFGVNYDKLVELKRKYDPENMFNKLVDLTGGETKELQNGIESR